MQDIPLKTLDMCLLSLSSSSSVLLWYVSVSNPPQLLFSSFLFLSSLLRTHQSTSVTSIVRSHCIPKTTLTSPSSNGRKYSTIIIFPIVNITPLQTLLPLTADPVPMITPKCIVSTMGSFNSSTILWAIKLQIAQN